MVENHDKIKELFAEKLGNIEAPVRSGLWEGIASQLSAAAGTTTVSTGLSIVAKSIIGAVAVTVIGATVYFITKNETIDPKKGTTEISTNNNNGLNSESIPNTELKTITSNGLSQSSENKLISASNSQKEINNPSTDSQIKGDVTRENSQVLPILSEREMDNQTNEVFPKKGELKQRKSEAIQQQSVSETKQTQIIQRSEPRNNMLEESQKSVANSVAQEETTKLTSLPNIFTPNGDNANDIFSIEYSGKMTDFNLIILDNQSKVVFQSVDPGFKWNGRMQDGDLAPVGSYYYVITAKDANGAPINKYSKLTITY